MQFLGHVGSENGVETDPEKIETLKTWPYPKTLQELRSFLGFSDYYRRFIQDYSSIVKPLTYILTSAKLATGGCLLSPPTHSSCRAGGASKTEMPMHLQDVLIASFQTISPLRKSRKESISLLPIIWKNLNSKTKSTKM